ncbi:hypothetical protein NLJ89_g5752 [Agrocybe chaxingu]|uniref:Uncharacterized protein n=1 Tax=Agrocybe chaxingu TaxID=84603 RepID=A0A9W8MVB3_9AGAR|nr:hypothetical protein NLJ89_g5752 [Agrocybe chaxingu]
MMKLDRSIVPDAVRCADGSARGGLLIQDPFALDYVRSTSHRRHVETLPDDEHDDPNSASMRCTCQRDLTDTATQRHPPRPRATLEVVGTSRVGSMVRRPSFHFFNDILTTILERTKTCIRPLDHDPANTSPGRPRPRARLVDDDGVLFADGLLLETTADVGCRLSRTAAIRARHAGLEPTCRRAGVVRRSPFVVVIEADGLGAGRGGRSGDCTALRKRLAVSRSSPRHDVVIQELSVFAQDYPQWADISECPRHKHHPPPARDLAGLPVHVERRADAASTRETPPDIDYVRKRNLSGRQRRRCHRLGRNAVSTLTHTGTPLYSPWPSKAGMQTAKRRRLRRVVVNALTGTEVSTKLHGPLHEELTDPRSLAEGDGSADRLLGDLNDELDDSRMAMNDAGVLAQP